MRQRRCEVLLTQKAFSLVNDGSFEKAYAVASFDLPVNQAVSIDKNFVLSPLFPENLEKRDNEIEKIVVDNGSTYVVNIPKFISDGSFISGILGLRNTKRAINRY